MGDLDDLHRDLDDLDDLIREITASQEVLAAAIAANFPDQRRLESLRAKFCDPPASPPRRRISLPEE